MTFPNFHFFMSHYPFLSCCNYSTILINTFHYHAMGPHSYHQTCPTFDFDEQNFFWCGHDHIEQLSFGNGRCFHWMKLALQSAIASVMDSPLLQSEIDTYLLYAVYSLLAVLVQCLILKIQVDVTSLT